MNIKRARLARIRASKNRKYTSLVSVKESIEDLTQQVKLFPPLFSVNTLFTLYYTDPCTRLSELGLPPDPSNWEEPLPKGFQH